MYLGASSFNARARATNFNNEELFEAIKYAKLRNVSVHLTLNTLIKNDEFDEAVKLAVDSYNLGVDAIIVQDLGLATYLLKNYPEIPLHASTQMTVHNLEGVKQLEKLGFSRVVLARELSIDEIKYIKENTSIELEVFIHGALCISYSGQCLMSSMIGGRSGNRGLCAQPCRLPYELYQNEQLLDKGYLLSPHDNCAIEYLPELIKMGITSFKIEGRMKNPVYVGTVTKFYRKYIDLILNNLNLENRELIKLIEKQINLKNENTNLTDKEELLQSFNRGGFSSGHFSPSENRNLIFKDRPNNTGIFIGNISSTNEAKGHISLTLKNTLSIGDKISIDDQIYTVSELMMNNQNFSSLGYGNFVKIGRMKGNLLIGARVYRLESQALNKAISPTFTQNKNFKKISLNAEITLKKDCPISIKVWSNEEFYKNIIISISSSIPEVAQNQPITKDTIINQISKTGDTEFEFKNIIIEIDDNLFVPLNVLNDLRRQALSELEKRVIETHLHDLKIKKAKSKSNSSKDILPENPTSISLLLNELYFNFDYTTLKHVDKIYIPLKYFLDKSFEEIIKNITSKFNTYVYMPSIFKSSKILPDFSKFNIKGFVISNLSEIELVKNYNLELIGNYNLNIYNTYSIKELKSFGITTATISPELNKLEISDVIKSSLEFSNLEMIVYGKLPVMTNNYCYLGKSNKCYKECDRKCTRNNNFYLKDRKNFNFKIVPDNTSCITTIYNSKIISIKYDEVAPSSVRIDILDESPQDIQNIIDTVKKKKKFEGNEYTNGQY